MSTKRLIVGLEEGSELRGCLEERNRIEGFQGRSEGVGEGPHRARCELRVSRLEIVPMHISGESTRNAQVAFDERSIDDQFRVLICDLAGTPCLDLLAEGIEVPLNPVHPDRQRVHNREVLRVLRKNRREEANNVMNPSRLIPRWC